MSGKLLISTVNQRTVDDYVMDIMSPVSRQLALVLTDQELDSFRDIVTGVIEQSLQQGRMVEREKHTNTKNEYRNIYIDLLKQFKAFNERLK